MKNPSHPDENVPESMLDDEVVRALEFWGEVTPTMPRHDASSIRLQAMHQHRRKVRIAIASLGILVSSLFTWAWWVRGDRLNSTGESIVMQQEPEEQKPESLIDSIAMRARELNAQAESLTFLQREIDASREDRELRSELLHHKRLAIRNRILLHELP